MKDLEKLKIEQVDLKEKLLRLIDFVNSEEYSTLDVTEKGLLTNQRVGMEIYLNALTQRIYGINDGKFESMLPLLMMTMLSSPFGNVSSQQAFSLPENIKVQDAKQENNNLTN